MLGKYLNQTALYEKQTGTNDRGQPIYATGITVKCRKQDKIINMLNSDRQIIKTQHIYYLLNEVQENDKLDDRRIMAVSVWHGLHGEIKGYKAVV